MPKQQTNGVKPGDVIRNKGRIREIADRLRKAKAEKEAEQESPAEREQRILRTPGAWDEL